MMTPLSPQEREQILKSRSGVTNADIDEYEQLLVEQHWSQVGVATTHRHDSVKAEARLDDLYRKLYGKGPEEPPNM